MVEWYYLLLASSILMGASTVIEKHTLKDEHASAYSSGFSIITALLALVFLPFANFSIKLFEIPLLYIISLISTATYLFTARIFKHGNISVASPIFSSLPVLFIVILSAIFLKEYLKPVQYLVIAILIITAYFLMTMGNKDGSKAFEKTKYAYLIIVSCFLGASGAIILKYLLNLGMNIFTILIFIELFMSINFIVYMKLKYGGPKETISNLKKYKKSIVAISFLTTIYRLTYYAAASLVFISLVSPVRNSIYIVITTVAGGILFNEKGIKKKLVLSSILIVCVYYLSVL
ncbi:DMT family transporter [Candidatus Marsarchaeota archaeon]|jgi:drug/metabolite transporter (DMT)-like permease|nr:DMT family transporter [Candidatus Marsarchaeota archaeon]MCL5092759.1 DMT family transporter [Candidatus Marsarchaeota archaeon]